MKWRMKANVAIGMAKEMHRCNMKMLNYVWNAAQIDITTINRIVGPILLLQSGKCTQYKHHLLTQIHILNTQSIFILFRFTFRFFCSLCRSAVHLFFSLLYIHGQACLSLQIFDRFSLTPFIIVMRTDKYGLPSLFKCVWSVKFIS